MAPSATRTVTNIAEHVREKASLGTQATSDKRQSQKGQLHSDISFEPVPSDYALLRLTQATKDWRCEILEAIQLVVRTNPVTDWKSVFAVGHHVQTIHGLTEEESLDCLVHLIMENHDLGVRHRWQNANDLATWDNRSVYHAATSDYIFDNLGERTGSGAVGLGERPYFNSQSTTRREALAAQALDRL
ncbi:hypothetical protein DL770_006772 [Monosporascus sp. CRB-9-2]|nr:hypothetical protein DL770_006772 [Monosporascus sp. CRB-9-2]